MFNRDALFGGRKEAPPGQRQPARQQQPPPPDRFDSEPKYDSRPPPPSARLQLQPTSSPKELIFSNVAAINPQELSGDGRPQLLIVDGKYAVTAVPHPQVQRGQIGLNEIQRTWLRLALTDTVQAEFYEPRKHGNIPYLGTLGVEIAYAGSKVPQHPPLDQDELADSMRRVFRGQVFTPNQAFLLDHQSLKLRLTVRTVETIDPSHLSASAPPPQRREPEGRGQLRPETEIDFFKDAKSPIQLKGSARRPVASPIIRPDFDFNQLGIGGLDKEFSDIFRRAFASRIFPPGTAEQFGLQHVRGILLYGPPGTGKTLIARQIGKMLNAREPKVINGPEVLNKFVGQSEENIRKLFADAEKEQKEKGDESGLHIIIFDELDAVCKQRGSGAGGGTGVGDSVVNQLLSKLDGVEQLNNILLIGMTNRKDMIDEALLRPGRLEMHMEISLPDEPGRQQILKIHTTKMKNNGKLDTDVDTAEIARLTRNFSGAELSGLIRSAASYCYQRHIKVGTVAEVGDLSDMKIKMVDFLEALKEVKPMFGANEEALEDCVEGGIIHYSPHIDKILKDGHDFVEQVRSGGTRLHSVLLHGPRGSGKTALAAKIALDSQFPFIKLIRPVDMVGMSDGQKIQHLQKVFTDAKKSEMSVILVDNIELLLEWVSIGPRFLPAVLAALKALLNDPPPKERPLLILATTSERSVLRQLQLNFKAQIAVPSLQSQQELARVMQESGEFQQPGDVQKAIEQIQQSVDSDRIGVGIQQILLGIQTACQDEDRAGRFAEVITEAVFEARAE